MMSDGPRWHLDHCDGAGAEGLQAQEGGLHQEGGAGLEEEGAEAGALQGGVGQGGFKIFIVVQHCSHVFLRPRSRSPARRRRHSSSSSDSDSSR